MGVAFEWTFRAGDVATLLAGLSVAAGLLYRRGGQDVRTQLMIEQMKEDLGEMRAEFKTFGVTLGKVATQEVQIALLMKWYDELRRGVGLVTHDPPAE